MSRKDFLASSRKLRKKRLAAKVGILFAAFLAVSAGIVYSFYLPFWTVKNIFVSGNKLVSVDNIKEVALNRFTGKYFGILPKRNILLISKKEISADLAEEIPRIKTIEIKRNFFDGISLKIYERESAAIFCRAENCAWIDENGFVFEKAPYFSGGVYLMFEDERSGEFSGNYVGVNILPAVQFNKIIGLTGMISMVGGEVKRIVLKKEDIYEIYLKEGWKIILNSKNESDAAFSNLITALNMEIKENRKKLKYVDLRFGNKIYFKYK